MKKQLKKKKHTKWGLSNCKKRMLYCLERSMIEITMKGYENVTDKRMLKKLIKYRFGWIQHSMGKIIL